MTDHTSARGTVAHELRNTLAAIDLMLDHAAGEIAAGSDPRETIAKARAGIQETIEIIATRLEGEQAD